MEFFKLVLFGISGLSLIFWAAVIGLWHVDMFPRLFSQDLKDGNNNATRSTIEESSNQNPIFPGLGGANILGLGNRGKYSRNSFVVADFSPIEPGYSVNRLYTSMILSLSVMSFILLGYGLHSGFTLPS